MGKAWKRLVVGVLGWSRKGIPPVATCKDDDDDDRVLSLMCDQVGFLLSLSLLVSLLSLPLLLLLLLLFLLSLLGRPCLLLMI